MSTSFDASVAMMNVEQGGSSCHINRKMQILPDRENLQFVLFHFPTLLPSDNMCMPSFSMFKENILLVTHLRRGDTFTWHRLGTEGYK